MVEPVRIETRSVKVVEVLRDTGVGGYAVARLVDHGEERVGIRWNGGAGSKGSPTKQGYPAWFHLPEELAGVIVEACGG